MGLRRTGSKVWKDIRGVIRAIGRSSRSGLEASADSHTAPVDSTKASVLTIPRHAEEPPKRIPKGIGAKDLIRKLRLNPAALESNSTLVQRSPLKRARSSLLVLHSAHSSDLDTPRSSGASDKISAAGDDSTRKTSVDSRSSQWNKETAIRRHRRNPWTRSSPEGRALSTIPEAGVVQARPTIATVERASAAKIFLETYFNELLYKPDTRALRRQCLESQLCHCLYLTPDQKEVIRASNDCQETWHLRELRVMKSKAISHSGRKDGNTSPDNYEPLQILGKGSFGVVRLVRERPAPGHAFPGQVYAMKVIRKSEMLRNSQEGHLRAERDFLVASEGSQWAVPLIASFQDAANLYLVMEYMPGGDFLGLLIRQNILREHVAQFYIAEMILAVEEAHRLNFIHRDIKPDNFLISASSHLKISDFGLAFDDHWSHDAAYYNSHRYSLVRRLGININGDEADQKSSKDILKQFEWYQSLVSGLDRHGKYPLAKDEDLQSLIGWRNRHGNRTAARSVVGTSQYMAPEVVLGQHIGIILYECLYGQTPFLAEEGRKQTKQNIVEFKNHFSFPHRPAVSEKCKDLICRLIQEKEYRLCSRKYQMRYRAPFDGTRSTEYVGRYVFANDAEDIKAHRWFRNIPWDRLQSMPPPFTPHLQGDDDAHYFDESEPFEDWSESMPSGVFLNSEDVRTLLCGFETHVQEKAMELVKTPFDAAKLRGIDRDLDASKELQPNEKLALKQFVRFYGHKERRRPRDMLLRDKDTRKTVMKIRRETAFIGYTWRRMRPGGYIALRPSDSRNELEHS
ncbi:hypothetical protein NCS52_00656200 [Fusarium sp. LHS14.1]|nr:hypothetical protein NCS52_00656200 [Fusarium sp. LHS14.1]